jgi:adenylate cyclase class 2
VNDHLIETEVKLYTPDPGALVSRIIAAGAVLESERIYERNIRYENAAETLTASGIVVRLRQDTRVRLTYKEPHNGGPDGVTTRFEAEVTVDDFDTMDVILQKLGYFPHVIYEKYRTTYRLGEVEITLDEMPYGNFIEIEGPALAIESTLAALDLSGEPRILEGYMVLFDWVKAALGLDVHDLTFENFKGVSVPPEVFYGHP